MNSHDQLHRTPEENGRSHKPPPPKPLRAGHYCILAIPFLGLLWPPLYARWTPEFFGMPFFYAYQFGWVLISSTLTALVYRNIHR